MRTATLLLIVLVGCHRAAHQTESTSDRDAIEQICVAYDTNEVRADATYKNKQYAICGCVNKVRVIFGDPVVEVYSANSSTRVSCQFDKSESASVGNLYPGQVVYVKGKVAGYLFGSVTMHKCQLTPSP